MPVAALVLAIGLAMPLPSRAASEAFPLTNVEFKELVDGNQRLFECLKPIRARDSIETWTRRLADIHLAEPVRKSALLQLNPSSAVYKAIASAPADSRMIKNAFGAIGAAAQTDSEVTRFMVTLTYYEGQLVTDECAVTPRLRSLQERAVENIDKLKVSVVATARLSESEKRVVDCVRHFQTDALGDSLTVAYVERKEELLPPAEGSLDRSADLVRLNRAIDSGEILCIASLTPKTKSIQRGVMIDRLVALGLADDVTADAERFYPDAFKAAKPQGDSPRERVDRSLAAFMIAKVGVDALGWSRFLYYKCRARQAADVDCLPPLLKELFEKHGYH